jgi:hypothetical protein
MVTSWKCGTEGNFPAHVRGLEIAQNLVSYCGTTEGKCSEVKHAHGRYANMKIAYLLQRMEEHKGLLIVAPNLGLFLCGCYCLTRADWNFCLSSIFQNESTFETVTDQRV